MTHRDEDEEIIDTALDTLAWQRRRIDRLSEALQKIADRARALRHGTDDWFELAEFEAFATAALGEG